MLIAAHDHDDRLLACAKAVEALLQSRQAKTPTGESAPGLGKLAL